MEPKVTPPLPIDTSKIPGWAFDAEPRNDPTWPMRYRGGDPRGQRWIRPPEQPQDVEVLMSIEHRVRPAVFGTAAPPSGLSGQIRRVAFRFSESRWSHWLLLMLADRINVVEGVLADVAAGHPPNLVKELGLKAAWTYDRPAFVRRAGSTALAGGLAVGVVYLLLRRRAAKRPS